MITGLIIDNIEYEFPADCSFNIGQSATTRDTRSYDYTKTSQSLFRVVRGQPNTYSVSFNITPRDTDNLMETQAKYDSIVGKRGELVYSNYPLGDVFIDNISFAIQTDSIIGVVAIGVTINMRENRKATPLTDANVIM